MTLAGRLYEVATSKRVVRIFHRLAPLVLSGLISAGVGSLHLPSHYAGLIIDAAAAERQQVDSGGDGVPVRDPDTPERDLEPFEKNLIIAIYVFVFGSSMFIVWAGMFAIEYRFWPKARLGKIMNKASKLDDGIDDELVGLIDAYEAYPKAAAAAFRVFRELLQDDVTDGSSDGSVSVASRAHLISDIVTDLKIPHAVVPYFNDKIRQAVSDNRTLREGQPIRRGSKIEQFDIAGSLADSFAERDDQSGDQSIETVYATSLDAPRRFKESLASGYFEALRKLKSQIRPPEKLSDAQRKDLKDFVSFDDFAVAFRLRHVEALDTLANAEPLTDAGERRALVDQIARDMSGKKMPRMARLVVQSNAVLAEEVRSSPPHNALVGLSDFIVWHLVNDFGIRFVPLEHYLGIGTEQDAIPSDLVAEYSARLHAAVNEPPETSIDDFIVYNTEAVFGRVSALLDEHKDSEPEVDIRLIAPVPGDATKFKQTPGKYRVFFHDLWKSSKSPAELLGEVGLHSDEAWVHSCSIAGVIVAQLRELEE